jgi:hypothetical protein
LVLTFFFFFCDFGPASSWSHHPSSAILDHLDD